MKRIFISVMALALMASCAKKAVETPPADRVEIKVASQVLEIESKIPYDGQIGDGNELTARVLASTAAGNYQADKLLAGGDGTITFTDNDQTAQGFDKTPVYYPVTGSVWLAGLYPSGGVWTISPDGASATAPIDGKTDLMAAKQVETDKTDCQNGGSPETLSFKHLLTRLDIRVQAESEAARKAWGKITDIVLKVPQSSLAVDLAAGTASESTRSGSVTHCYVVADGRPGDQAFSGQAVEIPLKPAGEDIKTDAAYVLCLPIEDVTAKPAYILNVKTEKYAQGMDVEIDLQANAGQPSLSGSTAGQAFVVTLTFKATEVKAKADVTAWDYAGNASSSLQ